MFDTTGNWIHLKTYEDFDNGLSDLIDLWASTAKTATKTIKESAFAHFKEDLDAAILQWEGNKAKTKKYAAIGLELAEFEAVLNKGSDAAVKATPVAAAK